MPPGLARASPGGMSLPPPRTRTNRDPGACGFFDTLANRVRSNLLKALAHSAGLEKSGPARHSTPPGQSSRENGGGCPRRHL